MWEDAITKLSAWKHQGRWLKSTERVWRTNTHNTGNFSSIKHTSHTSHTSMFFGSSSQCKKQILYFTLLLPPLPSLSLSLSLLVQHVGAGNRCRCRGLLGMKCLWGHCVTQSLGQMTCAAQLAVASMTTSANEKKLWGRSAVLCETICVWKSQRVWQCGKYSVKYSFNISYCIFHVFFLFFLHL